LHNEESNDQKLFLPDERMEIDLKSMEARLEGMPNRKFELVRSDNGLRDRGRTSKKNDGQMLSLFPKDIEADP